MANMMKDGKFFRKVNSNCWDPQERIRDMDRDGINVQALSTVPVKFSYWVNIKLVLWKCLAHRSNYDESEVLPLRGVTVHN